MGLGSAVGRFIKGVKDESVKTAKDKLYFDYARNDSLLRILVLHVELAHLADSATLHPIARGEALLMDIGLTAPRLEGLDNAGIAEWMRRKDKALPFWFDDVSRYRKTLREAQEHPELWVSRWDEPNPVDVARDRLERSFNFWLYPAAKPITELFDKYYHVPDYVVVREVQPGFGQGQGGLGALDPELKALIAAASKQ